MHLMATGELGRCEGEQTPIKKMTAICAGFSGTYRSVAALEDHREGAMTDQVLVEVLKVADLLQFHVHFDVHGGDCDRCV